jgi:hypothetical protein
MNSLKQLADLIIQRNINEQEITALIGRPASIGYIGENIASKIFNILLVESASQKSIDGHFMDAPFIGRTVNILLDVLSTSSGTPSLNGYSILPQKHFQSSISS